MKKFIYFFLLLPFAFSYAQLNNINSGEVLRYRIHYGILNAGFATLTTQNVDYKGQPHFHVKGEGNSSGAVSIFFKVNDIYESYINSQTGKPSYYIRNVREGKYRRNFASTFNHHNHSVSLHDRIKGDTKTFDIPNDIQDMISAFYYLRNLSSNELKVGSQVHMNIWIDDEIYPFLLKVVGTEVIKTPFGKINTLKIIPSVMSGRVFKDKEGVTMWISNDQNHIPIRIQAELVVGSLKADLQQYSNTKYPLNFFK